VGRMSRAGRWLVAVVVTVAAFGVCLWVCGALVLPLWLKSGSDRWVVAAGLGVAVAALAALGCASWAGRSEDSSSDSSSGPGARSVSAGGDISGIASTGDGTTNFQEK
jgi:hypothetical protein